METSSVSGDNVIPDNIRFNEPVYDVAQIMGALYGDWIHTL